MTAASAKGYTSAANVESCITTSATDLPATLASALDACSKVPAGPIMQLDVGPGTLYAVANALSVTASSQNRHVYPARASSADSVQAL